MSATVLHMGLHWRLSIARHAYALAGRQCQTHLHEGAHQSSPSYRPSPRMATADCTCHFRPFNCDMPNASHTSAADSAPFCALTSSVNGRLLSYPWQAETTPHAREARAAHHVLLVSKDEDSAVPHERVVNNSLHSGASVLRRSVRRSAACSAACALCGALRHTQLSQGCHR